jgi:O-antigen ligase
VSIRALDRLAWGADAPWRASWLLRFGFPALALTSTFAWFIPYTVATAAGAALAVALLLAIPILWREGYTWMVLWLAPIAAFDPVPTQGLRAAKYVLLAAAIAVALAKRQLTSPVPGRFDARAAWPSVVLLAWLHLTALFGRAPLAGALEAGRLTLVAGLVYLWLSETPRRGCRRYYFALWMVMAAFQVSVCIVEATALGALRSYGTFPNANAMGAYLVITGGLCYAAAINATRRGRRIGLWIFFAALFFALYLTGSRAAWLALALGLLVTAGVARHWRSLAVGLLLIVAASVVYLTQPMFQLATNAALRFQTGLTHRPLLWEAADRAALKVPLWGYGLEATGEAMSKEARYPSDILRSILAPMVGAGNPHNFYRELHLETGAIGLALFAAAVFAILRCAWRNRRSADRDRRVFALALLGVTVGLLVHAYFERSLFLGSMSSAIFYWFVVAQVLREDEPDALPATAAGAAGPS